jgi:hypothetical protein
MRTIGGKRDRNSYGSRFNDSRFSIEGRMTRLRLDRIVLLGALAGVLAAGAPGQVGGAKKAKLEVEVTSPIPVFRSGGPAPIAVKIRWTGSRMLEGPLGFTVKDFNQVLGRLRTGDVAVGTGKQTFEVLLPTMTASAGDSRPKVSVRLGGTGLGTFPLNLPAGDRRSLVVGFCRSGASLRPDSIVIVSSLYLDRFDPLSRGPNRLDGTRPPGQRLLSSRRADLEPGVLPDTPLEYCAFDVVVAEARGFARLGEKQLEALARWVEGGGSFLLLAERYGGLKPHHVRFLNRLTGGESLVYRLGPDGRLEFDGFDANGIFRHRPELGRAVVATRKLDLENDLDSRWWREAVCFLWKVRERSALQVKRSGTWAPLRETPRPAWAASNIHAPGYSFRPLPDVDLGDLSLPPEIRLIPFGVLVLILALFILAIGPIDYYLLGLLRVRWLTWIVFPLTCVAFTLITVWVSNAYLGDASHRQTLTFLDVGRGGKPLRQSRITFTFSAGEYLETVKLDRTLHATIDPKHYAEAKTMPGGGWSVSPTPDDGPPQYVGRLAGRAEATRRIWKWTPTVSRTLTFAPDSKPLSLDWDAVEPKALLKRAGLLGSALEEGLRSSGVNLDEIVLIRVLTEDRGQDLLTKEIRRSRPGQGEGRGLTTRKLTELIDGVSRRPSQYGFFQVVSAISPNGAANFEDLAVLDSSDMDRILLVVVKREREGELVVYRRLYGAE